MRGWLHTRSGTMAHSSILGCWTRRHLPQQSNLVWGAARGWLTLEPATARRRRAVKFRGMSHCYPCVQNAATSLPVREDIYRSQTWRVAHAFDTDLAGWLVVLPTTHVLALTELPVAAAGELGILLHRLSHALEDVLGCDKTYVMLFAEAAGFAHLHIHVVPRMPDQPADERGPAIFRRLGRPVGERLPAGLMDDVSVRLRSALTSAQG